MLIDNKKDRYGDGLNIVTVWDFIKTYAAIPHQIGKFDIVTGYFTLRALSKLYHEIPEDVEYRLLSSEMLKDDNDQKQIIDLLRGDEGFDTTFNLDEYVKDAKAFLMRDTVKCKAITNAFCHAKVYLYEPKDKRLKGFFLSGSSNLTDSGLGLRPSSNVELTMGKTADKSDADYRELTHWFDEIWKIASDTLPVNKEKPKGERISVKEYFIRQIDDFFRKYSPEEIYYKILFELFNSDIDLDASIEHRQDMSLLQTSTIWKTLFNYQQKGVISLIKMLRKYNGAILADAVGLGKTFSALAVMKYFQTQGYVTILLCPKKLEHNWKQYRRRNGSRFESDEFDYIVRFHTDFQNDRLEFRYDDARLSWLQRQKKILIVIDESHNLRNEKSSRYQDLMKSLIQNQPGHEYRDVKVLMLSATPINTGLNDVKGQFNLIGRGVDSAFNTEDFNVESLMFLFKDAQAKYTNWCKDPERTIGGFIKTLPPKFFNLTDKLIVARTRSLIEKTLGENLGFPEKEKPMNVYQGVDHFGNYKTTKDIYSAFDSLFLAAYQPSLFMEATRKKSEKAAAAEAWNDEVNRERFLVKMMGILFMKRLESSWFSLISTVKKVLDVHVETLDKVKKYRAGLTTGAIEPSLFDGEEEDGEIDDDECFALRKGTIKLADMKNIGGFQRALESDKKKLNEIYLSLVDFKKKYESGIERDVKLDELERILREKQDKPNKKVVIFTVYADTAKFIFDELVKRGFTNIASASGSESYSTGAQSTNGYFSLLQRFAPYSKLYKELDWRDLYEKAALDRNEYYNDEKQQWDVPYELWHSLILKYEPAYARLLNDPIDILIATDCLSEGQNLQDADMQINYDIHWNPVRLIQRFGRIDRIGSPNKIIKCVNFWPAKSFEEYLELETRIQNRMAMMTLVGSETQEVNEKFIKMVEDNPIQDRNADRLLQELQNNSISDIESPRTLSLKDFSFEVYRQDLIDFFEKNKDVFRKMPNGIFSGFAFNPSDFEGMGESLVGVVGYPHREEGSTKPYKEIYLMCQPVDQSRPAVYRELNRAEILDFLRKNKTAERCLPRWIETGDSERLATLSKIVQDWMTNQVPKRALTSALALLGSNKMTKKKSEKSEDRLLEEKFKLENFDLVVWEYITVRK
ncbi:MAG: DEAD/DEAH box helicase family protein [Muribaculaceae bacterium]|nr:DEAD/DEAH box helicase family protein [Muribaculaceae bacterium]